MADEKTNLQEGQQEENLKEKQKSSSGEVNQELYDQAIEVLYDQGGFDLISTTVAGAENMEPGALRDVFMTDPEANDERKNLKGRLSAFVALLESDTNTGNLIESSQSIGVQAEELLNSNIKRALDATATLEKNYRTVGSFFTNAGGDDEVKNVTILNASMEKVTDMDNRRFIQAVSEEFKDKYDRLDLMNNYSMLVIPGYMGSKKVVDEWARSAFENKVMLLTDFRNLESSDQIMKLFEKSKHSGEDDYLSNIMMSCNYLVGREQYIEAGEEEPLYLPPSAALAGKMYSTNMAQVAAGAQHGNLRNVAGTRIDIRANDLSKMADMGLIPMANEYGKVFSMSKSTLFNGTNLGLQTYSVVRTFDWLTKCMMDYLNRKVFTNIKVNEVMKIQEEISRFFNKCVREHKFLEAAGNIEVKPDPEHKDRVNVYVHATPFFPAKNFVIRLDGKDGAGGKNIFETSVE